MEKIEEFLIEAKKNTYASASAEKMESSRMNSIDYEYKRGNMIYHDTFFGGVKFMGEEVLYEDDVILWGMNYYGVTLDEEISEEAMDKVLRPALMKVGEDTELIPVRGPREFVNGEYKYTFKVEGDLNRFEGVETISKNDKVIYELHCHGGLIK